MGLIFSAPLTEDGEDDIAPVAAYDFSYSDPFFTANGALFDLTFTSTPWTLFWTGEKLDPSLYTQDSFNVEFDFAWTFDELGSLSSDFTIWRLGEKDVTPVRYDSLFVRVEDGVLNLYVRYVDDDDDVTDYVGVASASSTLRIEYTSGSPGTIEYFVDDVSVAGPYSLSPPTDGVMYIGTVENREARSGLLSFTFKDLIAYSGETDPEPEPEPQEYELQVGRGIYEMTGSSSSLTYSSAQEATPPELKPWYYIPGPVPWFR
jgi:hypothetical protein